jgi:hypothetical protein
MRRQLRVVFAVLATASLSACFEHSSALVKKPLVHLVFRTTLAQAGEQIDVHVGYWKGNATRQPLASQSFGVSGRGSTTNSVSSAG